MFYIIEHDRKGTLRDVRFERNYRTGGLIVTPRFSLSGSRNDAETAKQFRNIQNAKDVRGTVEDNNPRLRGQLKIRRSTDWAFLCRECGEWIGQYGMGGAEHDNSCSVYQEWVAAHSR